MMEKLGVFRAGARAAVRHVPRQLFGVEIPHLALSYAVHLFYQIIDFLYKCTVNTQFKNDMFVNAANYLIHKKANNKIRKTYIGKTTLINMVLSAETRHLTGLRGAEKATHDAENQFSRYSLDRFGLLNGNVEGNSCWNDKEIT
jgi:hypothetical protein